MRARLIFLGMVLATTTTVVAQTSDVDISPFAGRVFPDVRPTVGAKALAKDVSYFIAPLFLDSDGFWMARMTAGVAYSGIAMPTKVSLNYSYIDPDGDADHLNGYGASITSNVWRGNSAGVTVLAAYSDTREASTRSQVGATGEFTVHEVVSAGADVRWVRSSSGDGVDDIVPRLFVGYDFGKASVGADYTLDNDVDGESDYSVELDIPRGNFVLAVGAGKNSTWYVNLIRRF